FHLPIPQLHDRFLLRECAPRAELPPIRYIRVLLSSANGRSDRARQAPAAAVRGVSADTAPEFYRWAVAFSGWPVQEVSVGQLPFSLRGASLRQSEAVGCTRFNH